MDDRPLSFPWTLLETSLAGLFLVALSIAGTATILHPPGCTPVPGLRTLLPGILAPTLFTAILLTGRLTLSRVPLSDFLGPRVPPLKPVLLGLLCVPTVGILSFAIAYLLRLAHIEVVPQTSVRWLLSGDTPLRAKIVLCAHAALLAPITEELLFRGILLSAFTRIHRPTLGAFVTATLFALSHASLLALLPLFGVGLVLALYTLRTRSLRAAIAFHMAFNIGNLALTLFLLPPPGAH